MDVFDSWQGSIIDSLTLKPDAVTYKIKGQVCFGNEYKTLYYTTRNGADAGSETIWTTDYNFTFDFETVYTDRGGNNTAGTHSLAYYERDLTAFQSDKTADDIPKEEKQLVTLSFLKKLIAMATYIVSSPRKFDFNSDKTIEQAKKGNVVEQWNFNFLALKVKFGYVTATGDTSKIDFTVPFSKVCFGVWFSCYAKTTGNKCNVRLSTENTVLMKDGFTVVHDEKLDNTRVQYRWFAIGF
ncbi:hypothetical protein CKF54_00520 [Psittacicella hinzii]|uniref:Uncharacterized protein n=1 Tax=Psittacicella hinzii TaxID=2028575 RepID=A0A3A1YE94_9GAMM|nr:hypothetical protein CKF54_00520 [Psittacicella hinzii]